MGASLPAASLVNRRGERTMLLSAPLGGRIMRFSILSGRWFVAQAAAVLSIVALFIFSTSAYPQTVPLPNTPGAPVGDVSNIPKSITDTMAGVGDRNGPHDAAVQGNKVAEPEATCLFPPLSLIKSPIITVDELRRTAKARNEYWQGCVALKKKRSAEAEQRFRKAVRQYPKYSAAWVTLGQLLIKEQRIEEARSACSQASNADTNYAPAYLCLADIAAREHSWKEVLALSGRVLQKDPSSNFVAYEYDAAANLNLHNIATAEKSGLRAAEIDRGHHEPRIYFILAQIYEVKGDYAKVAVQLRNYLKYSDNPSDDKMVQQYLSNLERQTNTHAVDSAQASEQADWAWSRWAPPDIDASVPRVLSDGSTCPLPEILRTASNHTLDLIENMRRFSASEHIEQIDIDRKGKRHNSGTEMMNYVVEIEQSSSGYPRIQEYRAVEAGGIHDAGVTDTGAAVFALIFHPSHIANFEFRCEGLTDLQGTPAWQVHFLEGDDPNKAFTAIRRGATIHFPRIKGRAWISAEGYNVTRIETDLVQPIAKIDLQREHQVITYGPVEFPTKHIHLWLPDSSSIYIESHRRHYERVHTFGEFRLFTVDSAEAVKDPMTTKHFNSRSDAFLDIRATCRQLPTGSQFCRTTTMAPASATSLP